MRVITQAYSSISEGSRRELTGITARIATILAIAISLYHLYVFTVGVGTFDILLHRVFHLTSILALGFLLFSPSKKLRKRLSAIDIITIFLPLTVVAYYLINLERIISRFDMVDIVTPIDVLLGVLLILLIMEGVRRTAGMPVLLATIVFIAYMAFGHNLGGMWWAPEFSFARIVDAIFLSIDGIFGPLMGISSTFIILFVIFGQLLLHLGGGEFFVKFANSIAGGGVGGPAKVAIVASALFGTVSGSVVANVATTGSFTIPMMKKMGFKPAYAGAVEIAASTGGAITPPVMAGVVFLMTELADIPYLQIAIAAVIPAILYYWALFMQVHFESLKLGIGRLPPEEIPSTWKVLREGGQFFLPLATIVTILLMGYSPTRAALLGIAAVVVAALVSKETRRNIGSRVLKGLESGAKTSVMVVMPVAAGAIMVATLLHSGLGGKFASIVISVSGGELLPALILAMVAALILGAPLSFAATYILTAVMIVPAAVSLGVPLLPAHLFAVYFSVIAGITPPSGAAMFIAGGLAGAKPYTVGLTGCRLAIAGFIVPFMWVYNPALLMIGTPLQIILGLITGLILLFALGAAFEGWILIRATWWERIMLIAGALTLVSPDLLTLTIGYSTIAAALLLHLWRKRSVTRTLGT